MACLKDHESELSAGCQAERKQMKEKHEAFKQDCSADLAKFCSSVGDEHWGKMKCLKEHKTELTPACQADLPEHR